jgi:hypothetical protein
MRRWAFLLGGLLLWTAHFLGVYILASLADLRPLDEQKLWRALHLAFSLICAAAAATLAACAARRVCRRHAIDQFETRIATLGAGLGLLAIVWQSLPALFATPS